MRRIAFKKNQTLIKYDSQTMSYVELLDRLASLDCLLKSLSEISTDSTAILQGIPQALKIACEYADGIYEALANSDTEDIITE